MVALHFTLKSYHHDLVNRNMTLNTYMLNSTRIIRSQIVIPQTIRLDIDDIHQIMLKREILCRSDAAFEKAILHALPIFHAAFRH